MGPIWGRQVGPMLAPWTFLYGNNNNNNDNNNNNNNNNNNDDDDYDDDDDGNNDNDDNDDDDDDDNNNNDDNWRGIILLVFSIAWFRLLPNKFYGIGICNENYHSNGYVACENFHDWNVISW